MQDVAKDIHSHWRFAELHMSQDSPVTGYPSYRVFRDSSRPKGFLSGVPIEEAVGGEMNPGIGVITINVAWEDWNPIVRGSLPDDLLAHLESVVFHELVHCRDQRSATTPKQKAVPITPEEWLRYWTIPAELSAHAAMIAWEMKYEEHAAIADTRVGKLIDRRLAGLATDEAAQFQTDLDDELQCLLSRLP